MDVSHIHKIPSQQHLQKCLVESLETGPAKLTPRTDHHCTCQAFCFEKSQNFFSYYWLWSPLGFALKYIIFGEQSLLGKRGFLLKILKCKMCSPDLWSSGVWGLAQTWAGRTISMFWSLSIPHPSEQGVRLSDVSVWVTVVSCSRLPMPCRIGGLHSGKWFLLWPKVLWNLHKAHFPTESGGEMGQVQPPLLTLT